MDEFDYRDQTQPARNIGAIVFNVLTVLALLATLSLGGLILTVFLNPNSAFNPFPPPTLPAALELPTLTPTPRGVLPPTWTPQPTLIPTTTSTSAPSQTPTAGLTATAFPLFTPSGDPATPTPGGPPYMLAQGSPVTLSSVAFYPDLGCNWSGVAGQVMDLNGAPVSTGIIIQLGGTLAGQVLDVTSLTGVAPQYGLAGYEIHLGDQPVASQGDLWVQLLDQAGEPLSEKVSFDTYGACDKNLIFVNFKQAY